MGGIIVACTVFGILVTPSPDENSQSRLVEIRANQYSYTPHRLVVNQGDEVHLKLVSEDVVHGLFLEGNGLEAVAYPGKLDFQLKQPGSKPSYLPVEETVFVADHWGKFRYRCSLTCGPLHPFMLGEMIVLPNYPLWAGIGATLGVLLGALLWMFWRSKEENLPGKPGWRLDLLRQIPPLDWLVRRKWFQFALIVPALAFMVLFFIAGFWGSPVGNRNIIITFVWILWWFLLITLLLPLGSRIWCAACPFPFFGEWFQRKRLLKVRSDVAQMWAGFKRWPRKLSNIWLQNILFLGLCTFSALLVTRPIVSAFVLAGFVVAATVISMRYRYRSFCNYVCPVSGFLSLYSMAAVVEVRVKDQSKCRDCREKTCRLGSREGWGCSWAQMPSRMDRNNYCGMCMECVKTCARDNITLRARPFCSDTHIQGKDEAWKAFIMITLALVYSVTLLGPWGTVKSWANISEVGDWTGFLIYAGTVWAGALLVIPGIWLLSAAAGNKLSQRRDIPVKAVFLRYSYLLVPVGLCAWIAFSFPLLMVNFSYILATVSDPMGWGWDLFGTGNLPWEPFLPEYVVYLQIPILVLGLGYALRRGFQLSTELYENARQGALSLLPCAVSSALITGAFLVLFAG